MCAIALFAPVPMAKMRVAREKMKLVANKRIKLLFKKKR